MKSLILSLLLAISPVLADDEDDESEEAIVQAIQDQTEAIERAIEEQTFQQQLDAWALEIALEDAIERHQHWRNW